MIYKSQKPDLFAGSALPSGICICNNCQDCHFIKTYKMDLQWLQSDEAKTLSDDAKSKAWKDFKRKYPFADLSKFEEQTDFID